MDGTKKLQMIIGYSSIYTNCLVSHNMSFCCKGIMKIYVDLTNNNLYHNGHLNNRLTNPLTSFDTKILIMILMHICWYHISCRNPQFVRWKMRNTKRTNKICSLCCYYYSQLYIQLVYRPDFGTWILLLGPFW